jgi:hypothetical protein
MHRKSLAATNPYLNRADTPERLAINLATSTSVETSKPAIVYVDRYRSLHGNDSNDKNSQELRKKSSA